MDRKEKKEAELCERVADEINKTFHGGKKKANVRIIKLPGWKNLEYKAGGWGKKHFAHAIKIGWVGYKIIIQLPIVGILKSIEHKEEIKKIIRSFSKKLKIIEHHDFKKYLKEVKTVADSDNYSSQDDPISYLEFP